MSTDCRRFCHQSPLRTSIHIPMPKGIKTSRDETIRAINVQDTIGMSRSGVALYNHSGVLHRATVENTPTMIEASDAILVPVAPSFSNKKLETTPIHRNNVLTDSTADTARTKVPIMDAAMVISRFGFGMHTPRLS